MACRSRARSLQENKQATAADDHLLALELGSQVLRETPDAQALLMPGGLWYAIHAVPLLEAEHGRPDPRGIERDTLSALRLAVPEPQALVVRSDEHADYPRALRGLQGYDIVHECTSSKAARTSGNPLFPVNLKDLWFRQGGSNHKRETISFSKRHQAVVERAAWLTLWLNFGKQFSENHGGGTPAMRLGLTERPVPIPELLGERLFPERVQLPEELASYYRGEVRTSRIKNERRHTLKLAA